MHRQAAAHITLRTVDQLDELAKTIPPLSYDVREWATLGFCDGLLRSPTPTPHRRRRPHGRGGHPRRRPRARTGPTDLSNRLESAEARKVRKASRAVRDTLSRQWNEHSTMTAARPHDLVRLADPAEMLSGTEPAGWPRARRGTLGVVRRAARRPGT